MKRFLNNKTYIICALLPVVLAAACGAADYKSKDGNIVITAPVIEYATPKISANGGVHIEARDPVSKSVFIADSKTAVVTIGKLPTSKAGATVSAVKEVTMQGPVKISYTATDPQGVRTKSTASADRADYSATNGTINLVGNVKITNENPELYDLPAVATGEKATINLLPDKDTKTSFRFKIESTSGVSRIEVTPKQQDNK